MRRSFAISALVACLALSAAARTRPRYGGTLRIEIQGDPWQLPGGLARSLVLDTLTTLSDTGEPQPSLALRWTAQSLDRRWTFTLRPGVHFQDGAPLSAESVAASLERSCTNPTAANPSVPNSVPFAPCPWKTVRAVGDAIVFLSETSLPDLPELLAQTRFAIARPDSSGSIVGTGPFRVTSSTADTLTLAANDDGWAGRPFLDSIQIHPHRAIRDQWLDLSLGKADLVEVPPELELQAEQQQLRVLASRPVELLALTIAPDGAFASHALRQAVALAVDRAALSNVIFQKQGEISASLLPQDVSGYAFLFPTDRNLAQARALRGNARLPTFLLSTNDPGAALQLAAERLALNLQEAGFSVQVASPGSRTPAPLALRRVLLQAATPRAALDEMLAQFGQTPFTQTQFGQNSTVSATEAAERAVLDNDTIVPLLWLPRAWALSDRVRDLVLAPDGSPLLAGASLEAGK